MADFYTQNLISLYFSLLSPLRPHSTRWGSRPFPGRMMAMRPSTKLKISKSRYSTSMILQFYDTPGGVYDLLGILYATTKPNNRFSGQPGHPQTPTNSYRWPPRLYISIFRRITSWVPLICDAPGSSYIFLRASRAVRYSQNPIGSCKISSDKCKTS